MSNLQTSEKADDKKAPIQTYSDGLEKEAARVAGTVSTTADHRRQFSVTVVTSGDAMYRYVIERRVGGKK